MEARSFHTSLTNAVLVVVAVASFALPKVGQTADHSIGAETPTINCAAMNIQPGDTVTLAGGTRGNLAIRSCKGTASNKITFRNDPNSDTRTVIQAQGDKGFRGVDCLDCEHVVIDGLGKWQGAPTGVCGIERSTRTEGRTQCGIRVIRTTGNPTTLFAFRGTSKNITVRGVEIDGSEQNSGGAGIGMYINDRNYDNVSGGEWRENFLVENVYFHDTFHEGIYAGPNYGHRDSAGDLNLRNIEFAYNLVEDTGWGGLQIKSAVQGSNSIHHNHFYRAGWIAAQNNDTGHGICTQMDGTTGAIHDNYFEDCGGFAIGYRMQYLPASFGDLDCKIFNNVIVGSGDILTAQGIGVWRPSSSQASPKCQIVNNTIVDTNGSGIGVSSSINGVTIRDNIVVGSTKSDITAPSGNSVSENLTGPVINARFINPAARDFRLRTDSPAVDSGSSVSFVTEDYLDVPRPIAGQTDKGAFELMADQSSKRPKPPVVVQIQ